MAEGVDRGNEVINSSEVQTADYTLIPGVPRIFRGTTALINEENELEVIFSREFSAPREMVFEAWTNPEHLSQWWGPHGYGVPTCTVDLREGGSFYLEMESPEGVRYPMTGRYVELLPPERLVYTEDMSEQSPEWIDMLRSLSSASFSEEDLLLTMTVLFDEIDQDRTRLRVISTFRSIGIRDAITSVGAPEGWAQSMERLEELVSGSHSQSED